MTPSVFESVTAWVIRQYPAMPDAERFDLASAMMDVYHGDPQLYGGASLWRLHDAAIVERTL